MNKILKRALAILSIAVISCTFAACAESVDIFSRPSTGKTGSKKEWNSVSSFTVYYGSLEGKSEKDPIFEDEAIDIKDRLKEFDVAIIHSSSLSSSTKAREIVKELQDSGTYVIAYISLGEQIGSTIPGDGLGEDGNASYYLYENGKPKRNTSWGSFFVDAGNPVWQRIVLNAAKNILSYGVDGLFLDTLDTVDVAYNTMGGMVELVQKLDKAYPDAKLIANRGFTIYPYISSNIDGIMFESFSTTYDAKAKMFVDRKEEEIKYNQTVASNVINRARRYDYMPVFCLEYVNREEYSFLPQDYYNKAWEFDFIPYTTYTRDLDVCPNPGIVPTSVRGVSALKYFSDASGQAATNGNTTADNLAYAGNGLCTVTVDSTFAGYSGAKPLNDGFYSTKENHDQNRWATVCWASSNKVDEDHWIQFTFTDAQDISKVVVYWAVDNGTLYSSREAYVEAYINNTWTRVASFNWKNGSTYLTEQQSTEFTFDSVKTDRIRIFQPRNCGEATSSKYDGMEKTPFSGIMWVSEVEIYKNQA